MKDILHHKEQKSYLLDWYRDFYAELVHIKHLIEARLPVELEEMEEAEDVRPAAQPVPRTEEDDVWMPLVPEEEPQTESILEEDDGSTTAVTARRRLMMVLERQERAAERIGGEYSFRLYKEAQYVMAAVADEVMLNLDWKGRRHWQQNLLEARIFGTEISGERFFDVADRILREYDTALLDLAKICYMSLALGFEGRFRGTRAKALSAYQDRLFKFITSADPELREDIDVLLPQPYRHTLAEGFAERTADPRRWAWALVFVFVAMLALSFAAWKQLTNDLDAKLDRLEVMEAAQ